MKKKGLAVSTSILIAAIFSIFYAIWIPITVRTIIEYLPISTYEWIVIPLNLAFSNAGVYVFVSAIPSHLLRERNLLLQFLAHISSSTVSSLVEYFLETNETPIPKPPLLTNPLIAGIYIAIPFVIMVYIGARSRKETTRKARKKDRRRHN